MTELISNLGFGFSVALSLQNVALCLLGCLLGTLIGVLPGIGPIATIAILLPITFDLEPTSALIMLAGIYYGAQYGSSTTAILLSIPGEASSMVTVLDGHEMAKQGRAGIALGIAAIGSFCAGCVATLVIAGLGRPLTQLALMFGPAEYFLLMLTGLLFATVLARGSIFLSIVAVLIGVLLSTIGPDLVTAQLRLTFGLRELDDGLNFAVIGMGMFGIGEILRNLDHTVARGVVRARIGRLLPGPAELRQSALPILRGIGLGGALGILPGNGAVLGSFASYAVEKKIAKDPSRFGHGAIEGVAGPEAANNAGAQTSFIPLLTLGIPPNAVMAIMVGAMTIHGIIPGPQVIRSNPDLFWGMISSMWIGNLMLLVINLPLIGMWVSLLRVPYRLLFPAIVLLCCIGVFSINGAIADIIIMGVFGVFAYVLSKFDFEPAPLILGFVLGRMMEEALRQAMIIAGGDPSTFLRRPISATLIVLLLLLLAVVLLPSVRRVREVVPEDS
jgi:putative tricarboxylic transport membrane protein